MPTAANIDVYKGEDISQPWAMTPATNITGWTVVMTIRQALGGTIVAQVSLSSRVDATGSGVFVLTAAQTAVAAGKYPYDVWRTNAGSEQLLTIGDFTVRLGVRV